METHVANGQVPVFERMHTLDAEFLHLEDSRSPMHIGGLCVFGGRAPSREEVMQLVAGRLGTVPRYHRRVRFLPFELGRPVWVDDARFELSYHVSVSSLDAPHDDASLCELMGRLMSTPLQRTRPLWRLWIVPHVDGERWALVAKIHHSMVDGISGIDLLAALFDKDPEAPRPVPVPWSPAPEPTVSALVRDAFGGLAQDARGWAARLSRAVMQPGVGVRDTLAVVVGLSHYVRRLVVTRSSSIQGEIGGRRRYAHAQVSMAELQRIRRAFGCTINDVVLAAVSGGYRALLEANGDRLDDALMRSLVPASVRQADARGVFDNRVSAIFCDLPVHLADPVERLHFIKGQMERMKNSHMVEAGLWFTQIGDLAPPMLVGGVSRLIARTMHRLPQASLATVTTNVPGPRDPLYFLGHRLLTWLPYVPITQGIRVGTAMLSYAGQLVFGVTADHESVPDLTVFTRAVDAGIAELLTRANTATSETPPSA